jgi:hypothetical protein
MSLRREIVEKEPCPSVVPGILLAHFRCKILGMRAFVMNDGTPDEFIDRVERALGERGLGDYIDLHLDGPDLVVRFRWMGSSELRYRLTTGGGGFEARLADEKMSPFHAPFRQRFEDRFDQVLEVVGARTVE